MKYVVTGSSNYYLKNLFPESLSGRKFLFVLPPLSFNEYLYFNDKIKLPDLQKNIDETITENSLINYKKFEADYDDFVEYGGFPEVVVTENKATRAMILKDRKSVV